jgi:hypothetical protein
MMKALSLIVLIALAGAANAQTLGSCKIFPSNNPWNQRIDSLPVHPNSAKFIASVGGSIHVHPDFGSNAAYGIPWVAVNSSQAFVPITITSGWGEEDKGPMPIPANAPIEGGGVGDAHVLVVDTSDHHLYELYQGKKDASGTGWSATTSAIFGLDSNNYRPDSWTSCDAAGLPIWPGLVRKYECDAGEIKHALRFTVQKTSKGWVFPARHHAGSTTDTTNVMPMGMRFRLKSTFDDSKFTGNAKVIATALKRYGLIMADNGSNWFISGETNTNWNDNDISQLKAIVGNDFEAVYTGPIRTPNTFTKFTDPVLPIPSDSNGVGIPSFYPKTFPIADVEAPATYSLGSWLHNTGTAPLTITSVKLEGDTQWHVTPMSFPDQIAAGDSVEINASIHLTDRGGYGVSYIVMSSTGLSDTLHFYVFVIDVLGVKENIERTVVTSPNPAMNTVRMIGLVQPADVRVLDLLGREMMRAYNTSEVNVSELPNGPYLLDILSESRHLYRQITVLH